MPDRRKVYGSCPDEPCDLRGSSMALFAGPQPRSAGALGGSGGATAPGGLVLVLFGEQAKDGTFDRGGQEILRQLAGGVDGGQDVGCLARGVVIEDPWVDVRGPGHGGGVAEVVRHPAHDLGDHPLAGGLRGWWGTGLGEADEGEHGGAPRPEVLGGEIAS